MFLARYEPSIKEYLLFSGTSLYHFAEDEISEYLEFGTVVKNSSFPEGALSAPLHFQLEATKKCQLDCFNCYARSERMGGELTTIQKKELIDYLTDWGVLFFQWSGGDPTLTPDIGELVTYAKQKGLKQSLLTNGLNFHKRDVAYWASRSFERVQVSLNATKNFKLWTRRERMGMLQQGLFNIRETTRETGCELSLTTTVNPLSLEDLGEIATLVNEIDPDSWRIGEEVPLGKAEEQKEHERVLLQSYKVFLYLKDKFDKDNWYHCFQVEEGDPIFPVEWQSSTAGRTSIYMSSAGDIYPFPYLKMPDFYLGRFPAEDLREIWNSSQALKTLRNANYSDTECRDCRFVCVRWAREITFHKNKSLYETPEPFPNCPRRR